MIVLIQNCEAEGLGRYEVELRALGFSLTTIHPYRGDPLPALDDVEAVVVGGTPLSACALDAHRFLVEEREYLALAERRGTPLLGVCFGAQLLALLGGAAVKRNPVLEIGGYEVSLTEAGARDPLFAGFPATFPVFQWHGDTFEIPPGGEHTAVGRDCPTQAFSRRSTRGVQFHLEVTAADTGRWADAYADELARFGKTKAQVVSECAESEPELRRLAGLLARNFAELVRLRLRASATEVRA